MGSFPDLGQPINKPISLDQFLFHHFFRNTAKLSQWGWNKMPHNNCDKIQKMPGLGEPAAGQQVVVVIEGESSSDWPLLALEWSPLHFWSVLCDFCIDSSSDNAGLALLTPACTHARIQVVRHSYRHQGMQWGESQGQGL